MLAGPRVQSKVFWRSAARSGGRPPRRPNGTPPDKALAWSTSFQRGLPPPQITGNQAVGQVREDTEEGDAGSAHVPVGGQVLRSGAAVGEQAGTVDGHGFPTSGDGVGTDEVAEAGPPRARDIAGTSRRV